MRSKDGLDDLITGEIGFEKVTLERELKANLKSALLGGYSKKSVFSYVERLKITMEQMHSNMEQQVGDLVREKTELVHESSLLRQQLQETEQLVRHNQEMVSQLEMKCEQLRKDAEFRTSSSREKEQAYMDIQEENNNFKKMEELLRVRMEEQDKLFEERRSLKLKLRNMEKETERLESELEDRQKLCEAFEQRIIEAEQIQPAVLEAGEDDQIEELISHITKLEQENQRLEEEVRTYQSRIAEEKETEVTVAEIAGPEVTVQTAELQEELARQLEVHRLAEAKWQEEMNRQEKVNHELKERLDQVQWQMEENRDAMEFQKGKFREMEAENKMLEQEKEMLRSQVYEATLRQREVDKENQRNEILTQKIHSMELEKEDLEERLIGMKGLLDDMKVDERNRLKDTEEERAAYERLQQKFNQLYQQSQELRLQLKHMEQERRASDTVLEKYQKQEKDYILLKQNNESYLGEIESLESSVRFMFEQMNQQADAFKNLTGCYEDGKRKIQELIQEKTNMQLRNVELIEQLNELNQYVNKIEAGSKTENKAYHSRKTELEETDWMAAEFGAVDTGSNTDEKTVNIGEIKKRSLEMTSDIKERLNKQMGGA